MRLGRFGANCDNSLFVNSDKMSVDDMNPFFKIDISAEAEDTFVDDDSCDTQNDIVYEEHRGYLKNSRLFSKKLTSNYFCFSVLKNSRLISICFLYLKNSRLILSYFFNQRVVASSHPWSGGA